MILAGLHILFEIVHYIYANRQKKRIILNNDFYIWGIFYYNPDDSRILVPKRIPWLGWTLNFARPGSIIIFTVIILAIVWGMIK